MSIDAIGTQVEIAEKIVAKGGPYMLAVNENYGGLLYVVKDVMSYREPTSVHTETEKGAC
ncbi:MAG: hypothetical protein K2L00_00085 [Muribaculaceae bacterium]|nr:hypothetical protein [Muribaculaceae bacterium]